MLNKKSCPKCGKKVSQKDNFCPNCGKILKDSSQKRKEWGLLGNSDETASPQENPFSGGMLNKMIGGMVKMLEKEIQKDMQKNMQNKENNPPENKNEAPPANFKLMINGKEIDLGNNSPSSQTSGDKQKPKELTQKELPSNTLKDFAKKDKKEPSTSVKRFSDKVLYEINLPGVESQKELSVTKLENSIEVRARSKNQSYFKIIPIDSPITGYNFKKGKLSLEFSE